MKKIIIILAFSFALASCASIKDKMPEMPKLSKKACTDEKAKTLADVFCKKN